MSENRRRLKRALSDEQESERFSTDGLDFERALARVIAGGTDEGEHDDATREAEE